jgi:AbiV family abortive infection protein
MAPTNAQLLELVHALLENARSLASDARLLSENGRHARCFALAALAGEELGKIEYCLDRLFGAPTLTDKEFRRSWQSHSEKLTGLVAYQAAFVEEAISVDVPALRERTQSVGRRKMEAIYVDYNDSGVVTPASVTAQEAAALLDSVVAAVGHASGVLGPLTREVVEAASSIAPELLALLDQHLTGVSPDRIIEVLRRLLDRLPGISAGEWTDAMQANEVPQLLGLE